MPENGVVERWDGNGSLELWRRVAGVEAELKLEIIVRLFSKGSVSFSLIRFLESLTAEFCLLMFSLMLQINPYMARVTK